MKRCLTLLFIPLFLSLIPACAGSKVTANLSLKNMKATDFYTDQVQVSFVESVGKKNVARMRELLARGGDVNVAGKEEMHPLWAIVKKLGWLRVPLGERGRSQSEYQLSGWQIFTIFMTWRFDPRTSYEAAFEAWYLPTIYGLW